jgi:prolipoprotein diacylglyceryltransferase
VTRAALQLVSLSAAFWVALFAYGRCQPERSEGDKEARGEHGLRFVAGLVLGGALAHVGWAALYADKLLAQPAALLAPAGFCVLFVPLGPLAVAPWRASRAERDRFLAVALASLPLALATARLGCLVAGCCGGIPTDLPWGMRLAGDPIARHPTALYDIAGLLALSGIARRLPPERIAPAVLVGLGLLRLAIDPLRALPPLGAPLWSPGWIAALWIALGLRIGSRRAPSGFAGAPAAAS